MNKTQIAILSSLGSLKLTHVKRNYEQLLDEHQKESGTPEDFLLALLEAEIESRRTHRIERLLHESKLPASKTFESFDKKRIPPKTMMHVNVLLDGKFLSRHENVLIFGCPGSGKTHLACAIAHELIRQNKKILFTTCALLVQELLIAKRDLKLKSSLKKISKFDAIIIDDIGYVQQSREEMEILFTLLADRYETGSIMLTSNLPFSKWENIFKDPVTASASIDRLVHHSVIIELNIKSYRAEQAATRKNTSDSLNKGGASD